MQSLGSAIMACLEIVNTQVGLNISQLAQKYYFQMACQNWEVCALTYMHVKVYLEMKLTYFMVFNIYHLLTVL